MDRAQAILAFETLNRARIGRLSGLLPSQIQQFLEALPLLFQTNAKGLPGFISDETPAGIVDYQPTDAAINATKSIHYGFNHARHSLKYYAIRSLFLICKDDLFHFHTDNQFELWLVHSPSLSDEDTELLQQKLIAICQWSSSNLKLDLLPRLLKEEKLGGQLSTEDLNQLYTNGLHLAGYKPLWWATSATDEESTSTPDRHERDELDFGGLDTIDVKTVVQNAIYTLDKTMNKGIVNALDLVYTDIILQHYPQIYWPSEQLKQAIHNGINDPMLLDKNSLKLQIISDLTNSKQALLLAQQSFYSRGKERLSQTVTQSPYPWRRHFFAEQLKQWQWDDSQIKNIDQRSQYHYRQCLNEYQQLKHAIKNSMQSLFMFARQHKATINQQRLESKFKQIFDSEDGCIKQLPPAFTPQNSEEHLYLARSGKGESWTINDQPPHLSKDALYQHASLLNVLAWAVNNKIISESTQLNVADQTFKITINFVLDLVQQLVRSSLKQEKHTLEPEQRCHLETMLNVSLFSNIEHQTTSSLDQQGLTLSSLQADPLNYANNKQNLIASIEGLLYSSWGHWHHFIHTGPTALLDMLRTILQWQPDQNTALSTHCWCAPDINGQRISNRIESIYSDVITHYLKNPTTGNHLISLADKLYRLQWQQGVCDITAIAKGKTVLQSLLRKDGVFSASHIDHELDKSNLLNTLFNHHSKQTVSLFLLAQSQHITLYLIDDLGQLFKQKFHSLTEATLSSHFQQFLNTMKLTNPVEEINMYRLHHSEEDGWDITTIQTTPAKSKTNYLPVSIEMDSLQENAMCTIHCGSKQFSGQANELSLFKQVRELVLNLRNSVKPYPLYVSQLSFSSQQSHSIQDYILQKQRLEYILNRD